MVQKTIEIPRHMKLISYCDMCGKKITNKMHLENNGNCNPCLGQTTLTQVKK